MDPSGSEWTVDCSLLRSGRSGTAVFESIHGLGWTGDCSLQRAGGLGTAGGRGLAGLQPPVEDHVWLGYYLCERLAKPPLFLDTVSTNSRATAVIHRATRPVRPERSIFNKATRGKKDELNVSDANNRAYAALATSLAGHRDSLRSMVKGASAALSGGRRRFFSR